MENEIDLIYLWNILLKRKLLIISITMTAIILSFVYSFFIMKPMYSANVSIIIGKEEARYFIEDRYTSGDISMYLQVVKTYEEIAKSRAVYQKTKDEINDNDFELIKDIKVVSKTGTQVLTISTAHPSPDKVVTFVNALAENFIMVAGEVLPAGELRILDKAERPLSAASNKKMNIAIGFFLGMVVSTGIVMLKEFTNKCIECEQDVKKYLDIPILGVLPK